MLLIFYANTLCLRILTYVLCFEKMSEKTSRVRIQPSIFRSTGLWLDQFAESWGVSRDVAAARILDAVAESPWTKLIVKQPGEELVIEKMEILLKQKPPTPER